MVDALVVALSSHLHVLVKSSFEIGEKEFYGQSTTAGDTGISSRICSLNYVAISSDSTHVVVVVVDN